MAARVVGSSRQLRGGRKRLIKDLQDLGLNAIQGSFLVKQPDQACTSQLTGLWDCDELNSNYQLQTALLNDSIRKLSGLSLNDSIVESLKIGSSTVRLLMKDPLLPDEMLDNDGREQLIATMTLYDDIGKQCWSDFYSSF